MTPRQDMIDFAAPERESPQARACNPEGPTRGHGLGQGLFREKAGLHTPADTVLQTEGIDHPEMAGAVTRSTTGPIPKCGHVALVLDCCYVDICVIFSSSGSLRMRLISQFSRASGARFSETDDSPETVVGGWILPAKLKALLGSSTLLSQVVPGKDFVAESKSPLFGIAPFDDYEGGPSQNTLLATNSGDTRSGIARRLEAQALELAGALSLTPLSKPGPGHFGC